VGGGGERGAAGEGGGRDAAAAAAATAASAVGGRVRGLRMAAATWSESTTPASGRYLRSDRHKFDHVTWTDPEWTGDLDRRAIVQGSTWGRRMLRFPMILQLTCQRFEMARRARSTGLYPARTGMSAEVGDTPGAAL